MMHKVVITKDENTINRYLSEGWSVKSVTAQRIQMKSSSYNTLESKFCFVLKKDE